MIRFDLDGHAGGYAYREDVLSTESCGFVRMAMMNAGTVKKRHVTKLHDSIIVDVRSFMSLFL